jgi:hypothetical protein
MDREDGEIEEGELPEEPMVSLDSAGHGTC